MINLDYKDKRPIYEQISDKLKELMVIGAFPENTRLPSVRSLAVDLSINPNTIQRAYAELERQGYVYSIKGKGSFVAEQNPEMHREEALRQVEGHLQNAIDAARRGGIAPEEVRETLNVLLEGE